MASERGDVGYGLGSTREEHIAQSHLLRLELNFVVVLISANEQKARLEIQLLGWVNVLEQNRLGLMQSSSDLRGSEFLFSLLKPLWALHNSFLCDFHGLSSAQTLCVTLAKSL